MAEELSELEILYSPSRWSKRLPPDDIAPKHIELITKCSDEVQKEIKCKLDIPYGTGEREVIDIYGTDLPDEAPIFIHLHGGYWQEQMVTHSANSFIAKCLHKNNIKSILVGYELCPKVTVQDISRNIKKATTKCLEYAKKHNSRGIYLSGHSAGAQLVAELFESFVPSLPKEDRKLFKGAFLLSGAFDLIPLIETSINIPLKLDKTSAKTVSPLHMKLTTGEGTVFYVVVGQHDSPAFIEWSKQMNEHLLSLGIASQYILLENVDHFDLIEKLWEEDYELTKLIINVINNN